MTLHPRAYDIAYSVIRRQSLFIPNAEYEDAVSVFVIGGWLACEKLGRWDEPMFIVAGRREVYDAIKKTKRVRRDHRRTCRFAEIPGHLAPSPDWTADVIDRVALQQLAAVTTLSDMERANVRRIVGTDEDVLYGPGDKPTQCAVARLIRKMRERNATPADRDGR